MQRAETAHPIGSSKWIGDTPVRKVTGCKHVARDCVECEKKQDEDGLVRLFLLHGEEGLFRLEQLAGVRVVDVLGRVDVVQLDLVGHFARIFLCDVVIASIRRANEFDENSIRFCHRLNSWMLGATAPEVLSGGHHSARIASVKQRLGLAQRPVDRAFFNELGVKRRVRQQVFGDGDVGNDGT